MNDLTFLKVQALELRHLLEDAADDPILTPQLQERLADAERELQEAQVQGGSLFRPQDLPRAAIFLRGGGVQGSQGIRPSLAGEALIQYERMFIEQAIHDEREAARSTGRQRRPRGALTPALLFTGTPRGSFGLEFAPRVTEDGPLLEVHARSLRNVADALARVAGDEGKPLDETLEPIPTRVLQPLMQFLKTLAQYGAELRLAFHDKPSHSIAADQIKSAAERLEKDITQETVQISGIFRGLTRESGVFDLKTAEGEVVTGTVADDLTEDDLERIDSLTNKPCKATLQKTTIRRISGSSAPTFVLLDAV